MLLLNRLYGTPRFLQTYSNASNGVESYVSAAARARYVYGRRNGVYSWNGNVTSRTCTAASCHNSNENNSNNLILLLLLTAASAAVTPGQDGVLSTRDRVTRACAHVRGNRCGPTNAPPREQLFAKTAAADNLFARYPVTTTAVHRFGQGRR